MARKYTRQVVPEKPCANPECKKVFQPIRRWQVYCCDKCSAWVNNRAQEAKHNAQVEKLARELEALAKYARERLMIVRGKMKGKGMGEGKGE